MQGQSSRHDSSSRSVRRNISTQRSSSGTRAINLGSPSNSNLNANHRFGHMQYTNIGSNFASASRFNQEQNWAYPPFFQQHLNVGSNIVNTFNQEQNSAYQPFSQQHMNFGSNVASSSRNPFNASPHPPAPPSPRFPGRSIVADSILLFGTRIPISRPPEMPLANPSFGYEGNYYQQVLPPPSYSSIGGSSAWPPGSVGNTLEELLWAREVQNGVGFPPLTPECQESLDAYRREIVRSSVRCILQHMFRSEAFQNDNLIIDFDADDEDDEPEDLLLDINVDQMSYEELLALQEHVGSVCTGLTHEEIAARLVLRKCGKLKKRPREEEKCCICLEEYGNDEEVGQLDCSHYFHSGCITQWLLEKNNCPVCKSTGLAADE